MTLQSITTQYIQNFKWCGRMKMMSLKFSVSQKGKKTTHQSNRQSQGRKTTQGKRC